MSILCQYFLWFLFYSFVGWAYETVVCSIGQRRLVKRGFLNGPYCPIYGVGAVLDLLLLGWISNPVWLFLSGMLVTGAIEYGASWLLEKLFQARWWDYSKRPFNLHGRVCLLGGLVFGLMTVALVRYIHPLVVSWTGLISEKALYIAAGVCFCLFCVDLVVTVIRLKNLNARLAALQQKLRTALQETAQRMADIKERTGQELQAIRSNGLTEELRTAARKMSGQERNFLRFFPHFQSLRYQAGGTAPGAAAQPQMTKKQGKTSRKSGSVLNPYGSGRSAILKFL